MALYFGPLDSIKATFTELKRERRLHNLLLNILHDLITHTSFQVRRYVGTLLGVSTTMYMYVYLYGCMDIRDVVWTCITLLHYMYCK